jgi:MFS family permease
MKWYREIRRDQWFALAAAQLGWMLDAMDFLLYSFALTAIRAEFHMNSAAAGALAAIPLVTSAIGGTLFGHLSDRYGRARALIWSILAFSLFTAGTATSRTIAQLIFWRAIVGVGLGGEWAAGSVLVAESWPARHRGKAIGLMQSGWAVGYLLAAVLAAVALPALGWRPLFLLGMLPALVTLWIRRNVVEPPSERKHAQNLAGSIARIFRPPFGGEALLLTGICASLLFGYWGMFTWLPAYLSSPIERGGAGLSVMKSSAWIVPIQIGAFFGYTSFGFLADRLGRRPAFLTFVLSTAALIPIYGLCRANPALLMCLGPFVGFFGHGYFSVFGVMMAELFPPEIRATAQGLIYNTARALSGLAPVTVGALADGFGLGAALGCTSVFFAAGAALMLLLPETGAARYEITAVGEQATS